MKLPALLLAVTLTQAMVAMDEKPTPAQPQRSGNEHDLFTKMVIAAHAIITTEDPNARLVPQQSEKTTTTLRGVVKRKLGGGYLEAEVTYNSKTDTYSGTQYNHGYSKQEWVSGSLRPEDAKAYYLKIKQAQAVELH